jgi:prepilin-type N-terminal cleavage/methylation domain-containing protein
MRPKLRTSDSKGFTLLELLIVVAILGILASFAITAFQIYLKKAKSIEGETALSDIKRLEASYYADNGQFSASLPTIGFNPSAPLKY